MCKTQFTLLSEPSPKFSAMRLRAGSAVTRMSASAMRASSSKFLPNKFTLAVNIFLRNLVGVEHRGYLYGHCCHISQLYYSLQSYKLFSIYDVFLVLKMKKAGESISLTCYHRDARINRELLINNL